MYSARKRIQEQTTWTDVLGCEDIQDVVAKHYKWAKDQFAARALEAFIKLSDLELREWQHQVISVLDGPPEHRTILWIWSTASATGKTTFMQAIASAHSVLPASWRLADWLYAYQSEKILWFNIPRGEETEAVMKRTMRTMLEKASDHGLIFSPKYESCRKVLRSWVVVTANCPPWLQLLPNRIIEWALDERPIIKRDHRNGDVY